MGIGSGFIKGNGLLYHSLLVNTTMACRSFILTRDLTTGVFYYFILIPGEYLYWCVGDPYS